MIWEYLILVAVLAWAVFYLWRTLFRKKGCSCGSCSTGKNNNCQMYGPGDACHQGEKQENSVNRKNF